MTLEKRKALVKKLQQFGVRILIVGFLVEIWIDIVAPHHPDPSTGHIYEASAPIFGQIYLTATQNLIHGYFFWGSFIIFLCCAFPARLMDYNPEWTKLPPRVPEADSLGSRESD
jgi:hypothetical protein